MGSTRGHKFCHSGWPTGARDHYSYGGMTNAEENPSMICLREASNLTGGFPRRTSTHPYTHRIPYEPLAAAQTNSPSPTNEVTLQLCLYNKRGNNCKYI